MELCAGVVVAVLALGVDLDVLGVVSCRRHRMVLVLELVVVGAVVATEVRCSVGHFFKTVCLH